MGEPTHAFVPASGGSCSQLPNVCHFRVGYNCCQLPRSAHPASPPEPHSVAVALESRSLERDTPVAERGRGLNHPKGQGYAVAGREVRREPDTRSASGREGGSIPPSDTISPPEPSRRCNCPVPDCQHHRGLAPWPEPKPESEEPPIVGNAYGTYSWRPDPAPEPPPIDHPYVSAYGGAIDQCHYGLRTGNPCLRTRDQHIERFISNEQDPAPEPEKLRRMAEEERLRLIVHHMTLMLSDFGRHDPACCCAADQTPHAADCKDCECGLADAIEFGVEESGISLEPDPPTPEEEARLQEIEKRAVEKALAEFKRPAPSTESKP